MASEGRRLDKPHVVRRAQRSEPVINSWSMATSEIRDRQLQVVDFALVSDDDFRRRAYEERELWRLAN